MKKTIIMLLLSLTLVACTQGQDVTGVPESDAAVPEFEVRYPEEESLAPTAEEVEFLNSLDRKE